MSSSGHSLQLTPNRIEFADSGQAEKVHICFHNTSSRTSCFKVRLPADGGSKFKVSPVTSSVKAGDKINVKVAYNPDGRIPRAMKIQIKYLELEDGTAYRTNLFDEKKDSVKAQILPVTFLDLENADDLYKTPKSSVQTPAEEGKWWKR